VVPFIIKPKIEENNRLEDSYEQQLNQYEAIRICPSSEFYLKLQYVSKSDDNSLQFSDIITPHRKYKWEIEQ